MPSRIGKQTFVVGAGMAGLTACHHVGKGHLPKDTPQCRHFHALLARGLRARSAPVRNYGDVFGRASGRGSEPFVFDFSEEDSEIFSSEGPLKGRSSFLVPSLKG